MNAKELAEKLNGSEYPFRLKPEGAEEIKDAGLVIVFGYSDDLIEVRGAIRDESGCFNGATRLIDGEGFLPAYDDICDEEVEAEKYFARKPKAKKIEAVWGDTPPEPAWTYETDIPHETFLIMEDGEVYCRGIVFTLQDLDG